MQKHTLATHWEELEDIAKTYGVVLGGYQTNGGTFILYTSERVVSGDTVSAVISDLHKAGRERTQRIERMNSKL